MRGAGWLEGPGGFGDAQVFPYRGRTGWTSREIWLRRAFTNDAEAGALSPTMFHNVTDCEVYRNGVSIHAATNRRIERRHYTHVGVRAHASLLRRSRNVLALRAGRSEGRRGIDLGLYMLAADGR